MTNVKRRKVDLCMVSKCRWKIRETVRCVGTTSVHTA